MAELTPMFCGDTTCYTTADFRHNAPICGPGVRDLVAGDLLVSDTGTGMDVSVAAGGAWVQGTLASDGYWFIRSDSAVTLTPALGGGANRIDLIVATLDDASCSWSLDVVDGTSSAPNPPALPANSIPLAQIEVAASATSLSPSDITDARQQVVTCGRAPEEIIYTSSGSFDEADYPGAVAFDVTCIGGGGGSGGVNSGTGSQHGASGAGGGGGTAKALIPAGVIGATTVTVGTGGGAGAAGAAGSAGGATQFGTGGNIFVRATGGSGGTGSNTTAGFLANSGGAGGSGTHGDLLIDGSDGAAGLVVNNGTNAYSLLTAVGGASSLGGSTTPGSNAPNVAPGNFPGGGAGGVRTTDQAARSGSAGGNGVCIVRVIY